MPSARSITILCTTQSTDTKISKIFSYDFKFSEKLQKCFYVNNYESRLFHHSRNTVSYKGSVRVSVHIPISLMNFQPRFHWTKVIPCPVVLQGQALRVFWKNLHTFATLRVVFFRKTLHDRTQD